MIYGYARISRKEQNIERQVRNIEAEFPDAHISKEAYTGTKIEGRKELDKVLKTVKPGDTIVFDSVSRMSRNSEEGIKLYMKLYEQGINLVFLKEPHINTDTYRQALKNGLKMTGNKIADTFLEATNKVLMILAEQQIKQAFEQAEKEVQDLRQRTREGIETARLNGKQIGQKSGTKLHVKKQRPCMERIRELSRDFNGSNTDKEVMKITGLARNTYYKYKRMLKEELKKKAEE